MIASITRPYCQKVLPLVYDDSLSYYEVLCKLRAKINEVIDVFNSYEEIITELEKALGDLTSMQTDINTLKHQMINVNTTLSEYETVLNNLSKRDNDLQSQIDAIVVKLNGIIDNYNNIIKYVDNAVASVKVENSTAWVRLENYINTELRKLQLEIDRLQKLIDEMPHDVYNPVSGRRLGFDTNNKTIYGDLRYGGFTNAELSEFGLSNDHVASLVYNNRDYALNAKERFKRHYLFSPVSGKWISHANALSELFGTLTNGLTNEEFASLDMTNDEVVALDLTNLEKFLYYDGETGLTNDENSRLFVNNVAGLVGLGKEN